MKILIVDDHALVREGFRLLLKEIEPRAEIILESNGGRAIEVLKEQSGINLVLLDLMLGNESGLDVLAQIKQINAELPVIMLSASEAARDIREAIKAGASGYVLKSASDEVLKHSIHLVMTGQKVAPLPCAYPTEGADDDLSDARNAKINGARDHLAKLTCQEAKVLEHIAEGMSNKEIARVLGIFEGTVKVHVKSILRKLGAKNRTMAALMAGPHKQQSAQPTQQRDRVFS